MISQEAVDLFIDVLAKSFKESPSQEYPYGRTFMERGIADVVTNLGRRLESDYTGYTEKEIALAFARACAE